MTGEWDEVRSGGSKRKAQPLKVKKISRKAGRTYRAWTRMESNSSAFAQSYLNSQTLITELSEATPCEAMSQHLKRLPPTTRHMQVNRRSNKAFQ